MINIAIDGPAGAGKSTVAKKIAEKMGILYLDTGAMYRAAAYKAVLLGLDFEKDVQKIIEMMDEINIELRYDDDRNLLVFVDSIDVSKAIREHYMSKAASDISKIPEVRIKLVAQQRNIAQNTDVVLDGRDITSYVLPNAKHKFFLTASPEVRAKRRYDELKSKGIGIEFDKLLSDILERDYNDSHRAFAPLTQTKDSTLIDSSNMTIDEVVNNIITKVRGE